MGLSVCGRAWVGACCGSGSGGGRLVVWVIGVSEGGWGRGSVGELRKGEVVSKVSVATQSNLQKQSPAKHTKIEVRKRKYATKKKTTFKLGFCS